MAARALIALRVWAREVVEVEAPRRPHRSRSEWVLGAGVTVVGAITLIASIPAASRGVVWAEDGPVFLAGASADGFGSWPETYAGYLHAVPRVLATLITMAAPVEYWAIVTTVVSCLVAAACLGLIGIFASRVMRLSVALLLMCALILLPAAGGEAVGNLANLHWYFIGAAVWAALVAAKDKGMIVAQSVVIALAILSDPLAMIVLPLLAMRIFAARSRIDVIAPGVGLVASALQLAAVAQSRSDRNFATEFPTAAQHIDAFGLRIALISLVGVSLAVAAVARSGWARESAVLAFALTVTVGVVASRQQSWRILVMALMTVVLHTVIYSLQGQFLSDRAWLGFDNGERYAVTSGMLFLSTLALCVDAVQHWRPVVSKVALGLWASVALVPGVIDFRWHDIRGGGPSWSAEVREARETCQSAPDSSVDVDISPSFFLRAPVDCSVIGSPPAISP